MNIAAACAFGLPYLEYLPGPWQFFQQFFVGTEFMSGVFISEQLHSISDNKNAAKNLFIWSPPSHQTPLEFPWQILLDNQALELAFAGELLANNAVQKYGATHGDWR